MSNVFLKITSLPTRYEPLLNTFGDKAKTTFVPQQSDLEEVKRFIVAAQSSKQGKILFLHASSGAGKSTFIHSLEVFLSEVIASVIRLPQQHELDVTSIPAFLAKLPITSSSKFTLVNFDAREAPHFDEPEYQTFLGALNGLLRTRPDLLILWPVTDKDFACKLIELLQKVGGNSPFGPKSLLSLQGLLNTQYESVLQKILQIGNWQLDDAAVSTTEVSAIISASQTVGGFLDQLQKLVVERFNVTGLGTDFPTLVLAISSSNAELRETCRSIRRADSFYIEASRLLMYTRRSNVAEWWLNRASDLRSALPHVIALFNAQLVSLSASSVVHAILQFGEADLKALIQDVRADQGNARRVIQSSELYKFAAGQVLDNREYGSNVKKETLDSYDRIQGISETRHKAINEAIIKMISDAGAALNNLRYEVNLKPGLQSDAVYDLGVSKIALEFHHKADSESNSNKIAIYVLEKLKEYAINFGLAQR